MDVDLVVVGAGLAGSATAWAASRRGLSVLVVEQFAAGHDRGSSHGSARIVRRGYSDGLYTTLTGEAFELWREVEAASGRALLRMLGGLDFGRNRGPVAEHLAAQGIPHEVLPAAEAETRWPGMRFEGSVVFHPQAGTMDAAGSVEAFLALALGSGAQVRFETTATAVIPHGDAVTVALSDGTGVRARAAVVAAGGWVADLLGGLVPLPQIAVTQQQVFHFPRVDPASAPWPSVIHEGRGKAVYHLAGGRDGGTGDDRKIGEHSGGAPGSEGVAAGGRGHPVEAATRDGVVDPESRDRVIEYVTQWLPGLVPSPSSETTCLYTETPSEDFLIDRVGPIVVCSPCSGHGAKFAPLIGELTADLVTGTSTGRALPDRFRLDAHAIADHTAVSL
jgi:sarcosine oxidase